LALRVADGAASVTIEFDRHRFAPEDTEDPWQPHQAARADNE